MPEPEKNTRRYHLLAFALFALLTLLMTWPVAARVATHLAGGRDDLWVHQWTFWWVREALRSGLNPFFSPTLYAPVGASLTSHNIAWFNIALWLPLQAIFGRIPAYNLVFLVVILLNGFCMYLFAWKLMRSYAAALAAGIIFGFWPYTLSHYDHANMMVLFWVPLTLLLLHKLVADGGVGGDEVRPRNRGWLILGASLTLAMIGISRWQLLIMSSPILLGYTLYLLWTYPAARNRDTFGALLAIATVSVLVMTPLAAPLVVDQFTREFPQDVFLDEPLWGRTDLLAYFVPSIHNGLWQARVAALYENFVVNQFYTPFLGLTTLLLAVVGVVRRWKKSWIWLLLALFYFVLALGPELAINGRSFPSVPMPYRLIEDLFFMRLIRRPDRLNIFLSLPLAMLAGWGMQTLMEHIPNRKGRRALALAAITCILLAYSPVPFATTQSETPAWYSQVTAEGDEFAVLDLPMNDRSYDKWYMQYQTDHGLPLATGHVSRLPRESTAFLRSVPLLANLVEQDQLPDPALKDVGQQLRLLSDADIRYLILHKRFANEGLQAAWREWLAVNPAYEDAELIVYHTDLEAGRDFSFAHALTSDLGLVQASFAPAEAVQEGVVKVDVVWGTAASPQENLDVCLVLTGSGGEEAASSCQSIDEQTPAARWTANDLRRASYTLPVPARLDPGDYQVTLHLSDPETAEKTGSTAVLGNVTVHPFTPAGSATAAWQEGITLRGSELTEDAGSLIVTLYWQAEQPLSSSYKVFLHIEDANTGEIIAQSDTIPRGWRYPTTLWQPDEIVRDPIELPLIELPAGSYQFVVGLYDEASGERLPLAAAHHGTRRDSLIVGTWEK